MSYIFKKGATSQSIELYIVDSTDGTPETGVVFNSAGMDLKYRRKDAAVVSITEAALTSPALTDTWETGGFLEIGNGVYRLDLPDAALASASGIDRVVVFGTVTGMVVLPVTIHLTDFDLNSAAPDVNTKTATLTALDSILKTSTFALAIADAIWDEAMSGHTTAATFGTLGFPVVTQGAVETSGSNSTTQVQTDLAEATNDHYDVMTILFTSGAEAGQSRLITGYVGGSGTISWNAALTGTPADDVTFMILAAGTTADAVWDEILTGASHNITNSAGKRLRQIEEAFVHANGVIATVTNGHTFTLDAGAVATADYYIGDRLQLVEGTGAGQSRIIVAYTNTKVVTLDSDFTTNPDTSTLYEVNAADVHVSLSDADQAQGFVATYTNTTTITLDAAAVATTDYYKGSLIVFTHGTGAGQVREITGYTNGRVVTMSPALATALDTTTVWHVQAAVSAAEIVDEWELQSQADPTGFHINVKEVNGTAQTANDNSADINTIVTETTNLKYLLNVDTTVAADADLETYVVAGSVLSHLLSTGADVTTFKPSTDSLEALRNRGDSAWITATSVTVSDKTGFKLASDGVDSVSASSGTIKDIVDDTNELQGDWANGGRLDLLLDAVKAVTDDMKVLDTTIASVTTPDTVFVLTDGLTGNDDPNNAVVSIYDTTGGIWSGPRRASDYVHGSKTLTIDADTAFPLAAGDRVVIWNVSYATTAAAGAIGPGDIADIVDGVWDEAQADHIATGSTGLKQDHSDRHYRP